MVLIPARLLLLFSCWRGVQPNSISKMAGSYVTNSLNTGYMRQNSMFGIFGGFVPCERGTCTSRHYCDQSGGESIGYCFEPQMSSRGVCCSFRESCGQTTYNSVALFRNPNYPNANQEPVNCAFTMVPRQDVCGVRVEFLEVRLSPAVESACVRDSVMILQYSQSLDGYNVPFCGLIHGISTVIQVRDMSKVQVVVTVQSPSALWNIRMAQINCSSVQHPVVEACGIANALYPSTDSKENSLLSKPNSNMTSNSIPIFRTKQRHTTQPKTVESRIIGGMESPNIFPWVVALKLDDVPKCGGALITSEWVLTASHCLLIVQRPDIPDILRFTVILGAHNLYMIQDMRQVVQPLSRIVRHPQYLGTNNDIALLRLSQPVSYSVVIRPICLPPSSDETYTGHYGIIAGWGLTGNGSTQTPVLLSGTVQILDNALCNQLWNVIRVPIDNSQLCAGIGNAATCGGDSGGPLAVQEQQNGFYSVVGITSFGSPGGCGNKMFPDVSTRVTFYLNWIYLVLTDA
ncbi:ovochymase-1-like isoform X2 [Zootermopsis nevadensis]|uniref:ovochymase-1-like isoform X2 n=1 Tax=Zootermopsis nevadensis TaxID=136037 RepID=UPI000B8E5CC3|nr:ovochymase-1-like isoform X2 [Zootermopsis nevadensis]